MHHVVTFNFGSAKVCSPAVFGTCFSYDKDSHMDCCSGLLIYYMHFYTIVLFSIDSYSPVNKFYSLLFSLLKHYLELCITDTALKISRSLYCFTTSISNGFENYFPRL